MSGTNVTFGSNSISVAHGSNTNVTVTPASGYYLSEVDCGSNYTTNATTGISATGAQTVKITNSGTYADATCTFVAARYYTTNSSITSAVTGNVAACDVSNDKYYNCSGYTTLQAAFDS